MFKKTLKKLQKLKTIKIFKTKTQIKNSNYINTFNN